MKTNLAVLVCALMSLPLLAGQTTPIPPGTNTVNINVVAPQEFDPKVAWAKTAATPPSKKSLTVPVE